MRTESHASNDAAVQRLIDFNHQMQKKLSRTEQELRYQARKLEAEAAAARTDPLTLLGNRRALEEELQRSMREFREQGRCLSLVSVDLDHFKTLNDTYGHAAGDEVLRGLGRILRQCAAENAFVARVGGEEFAILIQGAPLDEACRTADVVREAVKRGCFPYRDRQLPVTASFGVAELRPGEEAAVLFQRADQALYMAKRNGRNCVYRHDGGHVCPGLPLSAKNESPAATPPQQPGELKSAAGGTAGQRDCYGLPDRATFCDSVRSRVYEWQRGGPPFSIVLLKIRTRGGSEAEHLPTVPARVLRGAATLIRSVVRDMDLVGYYSLACFCLLMPGVNPLVSTDIARRLAEQLSHLPTAVNGTPPIETAIGMAVVTAGDDADSLLQRAETALRAPHPSNA